MKNQPKIILISILGFAIAAGLFFFVIKPTVNNVSSLNSQVASKKSELRQLEEQITTYKNSQRDLSKATDKELIADSLLAREDLQNAVAEVEQAAKVTSVTEAMTIVDNADQTQAKTQKDLVAGKSYVDEVPYTLHTTSDFTGFIHFLRYLEHLPHFTEIGRISVQATNAASNNNGQFVHADAVTGIIDSVFFVQKK